MPIDREYLPWEPGVPQALQQHGGRNRPFPVKSVVKQAPPLVEAPDLVPGDEPAAEPRLAPE